jgi:poly-beta-1,6-N-acetyl-D-glucosamine biosynthesis protein PgaD
MTGSTRPWPPLIIARHTPRLMKWRDILLTAMMWGFFALLLDTEFELFLGDYLEHLGFGPFDTNANWLVYFNLLLPFLLMAAVLSGILMIFGLRTLRRRSRALLLPQPAPLETADQARRAGLDDAELIAARNRRIVIVHINTEGRHRIELRQGP